jgi:PAS domain S-box-containing protein
MTSLTTTGPARRPRVRGLHREATPLRATLDSLPQGLCIFDRAGRLRLANRRYREMLGLPETAIRPGMTHADLLAIESEAGHHQGRPVRDLLSEREAMVEGGEATLDLAASPGGIRLLQASFRRMDGGGFVLSVEDVTAARITEARTAAVARLVSLGEMAAGMAHELKQPLTAITLAAANAERATARGDLPNLKVRLARIAAQAERAGALIDHLRRFARGWDAQAPLDDVKLNEPIEGALMLVGGTLREAMVTVEIAMPDPMPVVRGHSMAIEQVLMNLLANANDALGGTPPGQARRISITVQPSAGDSMAAITIADNAGGIPATILHRLFQPFATTKGPERGTGLGLSICQGLVRSMGGTITAENDAEGAVFTIRLAVARPASDAADPPTA